MIKEIYLGPILALYSKFLWHSVDLHVETLHVLNVIWIMCFEYFYLIDKYHEILEHTQ